MTEEEAKTKWCPHAIASHTNPRQHNGEVWLHNCIGSACMAWRRRRWFWWPAMTIGEQWERKAMGRCGLAGKP